MNPQQTATYFNPRNEYVFSFILHTCKQKHLKQEQDAHEIHLIAKSLQFYNSQYSTTRNNDIERLLILQNTRKEQYRK